MNAFRLQDVVLLLLLAGCAGGPKPASSSAAPNWQWVEVPAGTWRMGSEPNSPGHDADESPLQSLTTTSFSMLATPVTVEQFEVHSTSLPPRESERCNLGTDRRTHPANCVDFSTARAFCFALGGDLPTESEWEYAARAGTSTLYFWGDAFQSERAVSSVDCGKRGCRGSTAPVVVSGPRCNRWGLCDLLGNVWEWTSTDYRPNLGSYVAQVRGDSPPAQPIHRGGSWLNEDPHLFRVSQRGLNYPTHGLTGVGFRCVRR